jgi:hypothetical protein
VGEVGSSAEPRADDHLLAGTGPDEEAVPGLLRRLGFVDIDGEAHAPLLEGGTERAKLVLGGTVRAPRGIIEAGGKVGDADVERYLECIGDPDAFTFHAAVATVWGRRPFHPLTHPIGDGAATGDEPTGEPVLREGGSR